jgi:hypothetical protein
MSHARSIRRRRVSGCFAPAIQLRKSLRATGVRSPHAAFAPGVAARALRKSGGAVGSDISVAIHDHSVGRQQWHAYRCDRTWAGKDEIPFCRDSGSSDRPARPVDSPPRRDRRAAAAGRIVQSQAIVEPTLHYPRHTSPGAYNPDSLFFSEFEPLDAEGRTFRTVAAELKDMRELRLDRDIVIPRPR